MLNMYQHVPYIYIIGFTNTCVSFFQDSDVPLHQNVEPLDTGLTAQASCLKVSFFTRMDFIKQIPGFKGAIPVSCGPSS